MGGRRPWRLVAARVTPGEGATRGPVFLSVPIIISLKLAKEIRGYVAGTGWPSCITKPKLHRCSVAEQASFTCRASMHARAPVGRLNVQTRASLL